MALFYGNVLKRDRQAWLADEGPPVDAAYLYITEVRRNAAGLSAYFKEIISTKDREIAQIRQEEVATAARMAKGRRKSSLQPTLEPTVHGSRSSNRDRPDETTQGLQECNVPA